MGNISLHYTERERLSSLYTYKILDTQQEQSFNDLCQLASQICQTPVALITLIDQNRQWFKAKIGVNLQELPREISFCDHTIKQYGLLQVTDATIDERFCNNPLVIKEPNIRFYAGFPLSTPSGVNLGSLCVIDTSPRKLTGKQEFALQALARQVMRLMEMRLHIHKLHQEYFDNIEQQQLLLENKLTLRAILDSTNDVNVLLDANYRILSFNKVAKYIFERFLKLSVSLGQEIWPYLALVPSMETDFKKNFSKALHGRKVSVEKKLHINQDLSLWYLLQLLPAYDDDGNIIGVTINASNIDKRKRSELHILSQNQRLQDIANLQSHKIRRPVATILGLIQILDKTSLSKENKELISMLETTAIELDQVIHQIVHKTNI